MTGMLERLREAFGRVFPDCVTLGQAVAFNMFLAFFPMLLFAIGVVSSVAMFEAIARELPERLQTIVPPGSEQVIVEYFVRKSPHSWQWTILGFGGLLIAGTQVLIGLLLVSNRIISKSRKKSWSRPTRRDSASSKALRNRAPTFECSFER